MRNIILILFLFIINICFGQKEEIELPKNKGFTVKYSDKGTTPLFNIYINKKGEVHFEDIKIPVEQLGDSLFKHSRNLRDDLKIWLITLIHADKKTPYRYVEKVKSQMSSALLLKAVYRTGHINDINSGLGVRLEDKSLIPRKKHPRSKTSETTTYKELGIVRDPIFQMIDDFYNLKFSNAKKILNSYSYKKVIYYHKKKLKMKKVKF